MPTTPSSSHPSETLSHPLARQITPSPEKAVGVEHRVVELSNPTNDSPRWTVLELSSLKKPVASTSHTESAAEERHIKSINSLIDISVRHVVFDFTLIDGCRARSPSHEEFEILQSLYPTQYSVGVYGLFLVVRVKELPQRPWPLTVAGLPLYVTTDRWDMPWLFGTMKNHSSRRVLQELDARQYVNDELFTAAIKWFDEESTVSISSILWSAGMWQVTIPDGTDTSDLPFRLCQSTCTYLYQSEFPTQREASFRQIPPTTTIRDDSMYNILRPGIMISSGQFPGNESVPHRQELSATAGLLVKDKDGNEFMTVASHRLPLGEETVYHPDSNGTVIGEVKRRLDEADIALVQLQDGVVFENKSFQSSSQPMEVDFTRVIAPEDVLVIGDIPRMDNPFTGYIESVYTGISRERVPSDSPDPNFLWVSQQWSYYGQHVDIIPVEGSSGSPICDEDGHLVCFFRYLIQSGPRAGFGCGTSAKELKNFGLEVSA